MQVSMYAISLLKVGVAAVLALFPDASVHSTQAAAYSCHTVLLGVSCLRAVQQTSYLQHAVICRFAPEVWLQHTAQGGPQLAVLSMLNASGVWPAFSSLQQQCLGYAVFTCSAPDSPVTRLQRVVMICRLSCEPACTVGHCSRYVWQATDSCTSLVR